MERRQMAEESILVGITGASGANYAVSFIEAAKVGGITVEAIITEDGRKVLDYETKGGFNRVKQMTSSIFDINDMWAPVASGSNPPKALVVIPCSGTTLSKAAMGLADNLLTRAIQVCLKEGKPVVMVPRETPLNTIMLRNMLTLTEAGVTMLPAMPGFYHKPTTIAELEDFISARVMDALGIEHHLSRRWKGQ